MPLMKWWDDNWWIHTQLLLDNRDWGLPPIHTAHSAGFGFGFKFKDAMVLFQVKLQVWTKILKVQSGINASELDLPPSTVEGFLILAFSSSWPVPILRDHTELEPGQASLALFPPWVLSHLKNFLIVSVLRHIVRGASITTSRVVPAFWNRMGM